MKMSELEKMLYSHAKTTTNLITPPFMIRSEDINYMKKKNTFKKSLLLAASIICILATSVFATMHYLTPKEVAVCLGNSELATYFKDNDNEEKTATDGKYTATLLGTASGKSLSNFNNTVLNVIPEKTYAVVAVKKEDNTPMSFDDQIIVTPLIQGLTPWKYNIVSMHGSYTENIIDGILYRIIEMDNIECFADQKIYMAIADSAFISNEQFCLDDMTGEIIAKEDYTGTNIIFTVDVDKSKSDPKKAAQYLIKIKEEFGDKHTIEESNILPLTKDINVPSLEKDK